MFLIEADKQSKEETIILFLLQGKSFSFETITHPIFVTRFKLILENMKIYIDSEK